MMTKTIIAAAVALSLTGCGTIGKEFREMADAGPQDPVVSATVLKKQERIAPPATGALTVAVYNFRDLTGQRKASSTLASLSSAVTQGADAYLIRSLQTVGDGRWFKVVERGGLDNLIKERQIIRQMRELYEGKDAKPLPPMVFAGMLLEGGIVGYDSNTMSGGSGVRILGIGPQTEYRQDEVTISIRAVSVATGEVLTSVTVGKTVISYQDKLGVLRFNELGTQAVEAEIGSATNESMNKAVQLAIQAAVIETIKQGVAKGHWQFQSEVKEAKNELVQQKPAQAEAKPKVEAPAPQPVVKPVVAEDKKPAPEPAPQQPVQRPAEPKWEAAVQLNVRETNVSGSKVIGVAEKGTELKVLEKANRVSKVEFVKDGKTIQGWVLTEFVNPKK